jgi:hypothetical protein
MKRCPIGKRRNKRTRKCVAKNAAFNGPRVNLSPYRVDRGDDYTTYRGVSRWAKVAQLYDKTWYVAKGWKGDFKAERVEHTGKGRMGKDLAFITAQGWIRED